MSSNYRSICSGTQTIQTLRNAMTQVHKAESTLYKYEDVNNDDPSVMYIHASPCQDQRVMAKKSQAQAVNLNANTTAINLNWKANLTCYK